MCCFKHSDSSYQSPWEIQRNPSTSWPNWCHDCCSSTLHHCCKGFKQ